MQLDEVENPNQGENPLELEENIEDVVEPGRTSR